jgi:hypothetical protein
MREEVGREMNAKDSYKQQVEANIARRVLEKVMYGDTVIVRRGSYGCQTDECEQWESGECFDTNRKQHWGQLTQCPLGYRVSVNITDRM